MIFYEVIPQSNIIRLGGAFMVSLATVNVKNVGKINVLKELTGQLLCQEDTRSTHDNGERSARLLHSTNGVIDHDESLASASRSDDLPKLVLDHGGNALLLLGSEFHVKSVSIQIV
jgi:hypothetical protein